MDAEINISLTFRQIVGLVKQLPREKKILLSKELEKEAIATKLTRLLQSFKTNDLSEELISSEAEIVRQQLYEQSKKH